MATVQEESDRIIAFEAKWQKVEKEVTKLRADFDIVVANAGNVQFPTPGTEALNRMGAGFQRIDDLNEDAPATPAPQPTPE